MEPQLSKKYEHGQAQIFKNPFLESLTKTNPVSNIIIYGLAITLMVYWAISVQGISILNFIGLYVFGMCFWTLAEYILHRYVFHWVTDAEWSKRFHFVMHGSHHEFPRDKDRLLMPPVPGLILASFLFGIFFVVFWLLGITTLVYGFFPGFFSGYLMYSFVHRATHVNRPPKRFKKLWLHHSLHHYKYPNKAFGVSNRFWDRVFGTMPPERH
ncbi:sterol desaturase family protein [Formosa sp. PL04]|uniref:sterol desaturase family protein n=1 Tax=Formosa sp. PL04 TaxID=3081755 RepID=UPI002981B39B|nr:sterol desaturase family protein [Formosa sp. PL04]MDW5290019.1 sterol desaturase family protein [Formosa sp. PL04]